MWIRERIYSEYKKHKKTALDWSKIAEAKIKGQIKEILREINDDLRKSNKIWEISGDQLNDLWEEEVIKRCGLQ